MSSFQADPSLHHDSSQEDSNMSAQNQADRCHPHRQAIADTSGPSHSSDLLPPPSNQPGAPPTLPELPTADLAFSLDAILGPSPSLQSSSSPSREEHRPSARVQKRVSLVQKRQSNVLKLSEENDQLKEELRAMTERLEAAERRRRELEQRVPRA